MELFKSLKSKTRSYDIPFKHFELNEPLTKEAIKEICLANIADPRKENLNYDGTRALDGGEGGFRAGIKDGGKAKKLRCYITKENSKLFPHLTNFIEELRSEEVHKKIGSLIGKDLTNSFVRLEVICDREGFWLKPHCDIKEKLMSSTVPYKNNYGYFFTSGPNTWHGMEKKEIKKERRCIQINYVTFPTDWKVK